MLLFTEAETATYIVNISPVPLYVMVGARYRSITQPGFGRPSMVRLEHPNNQSTIVQFNTVTPRDSDLDFQSVMYMEPGDYIGIKFSKDVLTNTTPYMVILASDDASTLQELARPPRDDYEGVEVTPSTEVSAHNVRWTGNPTDADKLGAGTALDSVPGVTYNPATGVVTNYGGVFGAVLVTYQSTTAFNFIRAGRSDGILNNQGRVFMWIEFDPNVPAAVDFLLVPIVGGNLQASIMFFPYSYDKRFSV